MAQWIVGREGGKHSKRRKGEGQEAESGGYKGVAKLSAAASARGYELYQGGGLGGEVTLK